MVFLLVFLILLFPSLISYYEFVTGEVESVEIEDLEVAEVTMGQVSESPDENPPERPLERLRFHDRTGSLVSMLSMLSV